MADTTIRGAAAIEAPEPHAGHDFSLVLGGPVFQILRRTHLSDDTLGLLHRRVLFVLATLWVPLAVLSAVEGGLTGSGRATPFLADIGFQLRFLVVAPILIIAEWIVHRRLTPIVQQFELRGLVRPHEEQRFHAALAQAHRWRNSVLAELALLVAVYAIGVPVTFGRYAAFGGDAWYDNPGGRLSLAGAWLVFVSVPLFQFLMLRWYFRLIIWARFLWRVSLLDLDLNVLHPDKSGGIGFLSGSLGAFLPLATAHGVLFSGVLADRILRHGARLTDFRLELLGGGLLLLAVFVGPMVAFMPRLAHVRREGMRTYGALGQVYVRQFRSKWLSGRPPPDEPLVGSGDIQSLADLGNAFSTADQTRLIPIRPPDLIQFIVAFLLPIAPLVLTLMSADKLIDQMIGMVF